MSQVKEQTGGLDETRDDPSNNDMEKSPESNEARELRIEIIRQEGRRVRALRMKVSHFLNSTNYRSPNQFLPNSIGSILKRFWTVRLTWSSLVWFEPFGSWFDIMHDLVFCFHIFHHEKNIQFYSDSGIWDLRTGWFYLDENRNRFMNSIRVSLKLKFLELNVFLPVVFAKIMIYYLKSSVWTNRAFRVIKLGQCGRP